MPVTFWDKLQGLLSSFSPAQASVAIRKLLEYSGLVVTLLSLLHVSPAIIATVNDVFANISANQAGIIAWIGSFITAALYVFSLFKNSKGQQIKAVEKQDGLVVGVDTSPDSKAPKVAIQAANDDNRKSVVALANVPDKVA